MSDVRTEWQPIDSEVWRPIIGWTQYEVSNCGRVRNGDRILGQWKNSNGYMVVRLSRPRAQRFVHRLVGMSFIPNPGNKPFINHIDCAPANNTVANLEWCTQKENLAHSARLGRMQRDYWVGKRTPIASLGDEDVRHLRTRHAVAGESWAALGRAFGISKRSVGRILHGETYADVE